MSDPLEEAIKRGNEIRPKFAGMAMVIAGLNHLDAMMQAVFWLSPNDRLDGARPIDLVEKDPLAVHAAAEMFGEQGAV